MIYQLSTHRPSLHPSVWVAANASVIGNVIVHQDASIWFGCVVRGDHEPAIEIGSGTNIQDNSVLHTDSGLLLRLGNHVTVGHRVIVHGATVGDGSLIGMGAVLLNRAKIGSNCLVGANALVTEGKVFPDGVLIVGSPARAIRDVTPEEVASMRNAAQHYIANAQRFRDSLQVVS